jgi:hypothetical protein
MLTDGNEGKKTEPVNIVAYFFRPIKHNDTIMRQADMLDMLILPKSNDISARLFSMPRSGIPSRSDSLISGQSPLKPHFAWHNSNRFDRRMPQFPGLIWH